MSTMKDIEIGGDGKLVGRDDNSVILSSTTINHSPSKTKLSVLFDKLKEQSEKEEQTECAQVGNFGQKVFEDIRNGDPLEI